MEKVVCSIKDGVYEHEAFLETKKGQRLDVALRKWVEENGDSKKSYVLISVAVPAMKIETKLVKEVLFV